VAGFDSGVVPGAAGGRAPGSVSVTANGVTTASAGPITQIRLRSGGGRDLVSYTFTSALAPGVLRMLDVDLGSDRDTFLFTVAGVQPRANLDVSVNAGPGDDTLRVNATPAADVAPGATFRMGIACGDDADRCTVTYQGKVAGSLLVRVEGNPGMDRVSADFTLLAGSTGLVKTEVRGGTNVDRLGLFVRKQDPADSVSISNLMDGGQSIDLCRHTDNVAALKCEL